MLEVRPHAISLPMADNERAFYVQLGERIAATRKAQGITQVQLAELLGVAQQTMAHYEGGTVRIPVETLAQLAQHLNTSVEALIGTSTTKARSKRGPASILQRQIEQIGLMPRTKQRFITEMLEALIKQQAS
jgi:transcriptional regulator with XRE-family HTH domain